ncbi:MAG: type II toxin-antitoxin system RelB/DinJ family antitoxin [Clostridiales bacterium]|jgi:addiction module RelB/DinJ family antitoxin|nr:type II toxin-antitoxin system RelB/DinJ family antitoxin [Clostridiales bacterium]
MAKTETVYTRVDPMLKANVEQVLSQLGLTASEAINIFLNQVVLQKGLPFAVKVPPMTKSEAQAVLMSKLKEAEDAIANGGEWLTAEESMTRLGV